MKLTYHGHSCFTLDFDGYKIVVDPFNEVPGYEPYTLEANEILPSHDHFDHNYVEAVKVTPADRPEGLKITEIHSFHDPEGGKLRGENILRIFEYKGLRVMHAGDIGVHPTPEQTELMKNLDVLMIPTGGTFTLNEKESKVFAEEIGAKVVVPMHYRNGKYGFDVISTLDDFVKLYDHVNYAEGSYEFTGKEDPQVLVFKF